jgi:nickel-dependent lactate racemase
MIGTGSKETFLGEDDLRAIVRKAGSEVSLSGKRVLVIIPDGTRTMPMPLMFRLLQEEWLPHTEALDFLVALGTHQPMSDDHLSRHLGVEVEAGRAGGSAIINHAWHKPETFVELGVIGADEIESLSQGKLVMDVPVRLNKLVLDYDQIILLGPVFPHEVVGFSGGNKYFFPGIAGEEIIHFTHWLGALMTSYEIIGSGYTPVRAVIDRAAAMIPTPAACLALVLVHEGVHGCFFGSAQETWQAASALSAQVHIRYVEKPYQKILAIMPELYEDVWTGAKGMYKMEPVVADGSEVVIYAPHITELSYSHGEALRRIGYHVRDYFVKQWEQYKHEPWGVLAHSTHARGIGSYDADSGVETPRVQVTLATGIPREVCESVNLGYMDPASINLTDWEGREDEGILVVPRAGEMLYRLKKE